MGLNAVRAVDGCLVPPNRTHTHTHTHTRLARSSFIQYTTNRWPPSSSFLFPVSSLSLILIYIYTHIYFFFSFSLSVLFCFFILDLIINIYSFVARPFLGFHGVGLLVSRIWKFFPLTGHFPNCLRWWRAHRNHLAAPISTCIVWCGNVYEFGMRFTRWPSLDSNNSTDRKNGWCILSLELDSVSSPSGCGRN